MVSNVAIERGAVSLSVCTIDDDCGQCPYQTGCWFVEPLVVS